LSSLQKQTPFKPARLPGITHTRAQAQKMGIKQGVMVNEMRVEKIFHSKIHIAKKLQNYF